MARFRLPFLAGLIASFALPSRADLHAQHVWTRADSSPDARIEHALAFDGARGVVVMHGGRSLDGLLADTWEWDGNNWTQVPTRSGPAALSGHALGYDPLSRRLLLVNGTRTTWIWSGADWTAQSTSSVSGTGGRMSFDLNRNALVHATHAGLFEWTGSDWNKIGSGPGWGRFAYDSRRARHVCVRQAPPPFGTEVLEWSGSIRVWRGSLFQSPSQRSGFDVVYDARRVWTAAKACPLDLGVGRFVAERELFRSHPGYRAVGCEALRGPGHRRRTLRHPPGSAHRDCPLHLRHPQRQARRAPRDGSLARARCRELLRSLAGRARGLWGLAIPWRGSELPVSSQGI
jgi:hypothetical protein